MGIYNRDYIREPRPTGGFSGHSGLWAIKALLIANVLVFFLQNSSPQIADWLALQRDALFPSFQIWRLVTYGFCHSTQGLNHILFNMFVLWMFGRSVEPIYGSREFLAFYLGGVVVSGLCHVLISPYPVVGASGGVMAVVFLTAMNFPKMKVLLMFVIPIELRWLAVLYATVDVLGFFQDSSNVAHAAHLGGAAFGVAYKYKHWRIMPWVDRLGHLSSLRMPKSRPKVRVFRPSADENETQVDDIKAKVDAILEKISQQGEASLTDKEREFLKDASRRYKNR